MFLRTFGLWISLTAGAEVSDVSCDMGAFWTKEICFVAN